MKKPLSKAVHAIDMSLIDPPGNRARLEVNQEYVRELAASIAENGQLQPIVLCIRGPRFEIVAGEMRYLATKLNESPTVDAVTREMTDKEVAIARATENLNRRDLTPLEEALSYIDLIDNHGMGIEEVGKKFGKTAGTIRHRMDLLKMPPILQQAVHKKEISVSAAEELWPISDQTALEYYLIFAVENGCTKEVARQWCKSWKDSKRRDMEPGVEGGGYQGPLEPRPIFIGCDLCHGPVELEQAVRLTICPGCHAVIKSNM